jgi:hypothetical protein
VPGGGFSPDGSRWVACRKDSFFLPYKVLSHLFRKLFLLSLGKAFRKGQLHLSGELRDLTKPAAFRQSTPAVLSAMAYVLVCGLRRLGLKATELATCQAATIRLRLLKIGALVRVSVRRVWISLPRSYSWPDLFAQVHQALSG